MKNFVATHVCFDAYTADHKPVEVWVRVEDANEYYRVHQTETISKIQFDGDSRFWSFGKQWMFWDGENWNIARIGAGAYGDSVIWRNPILNDAEQLAELRRKQAEYFAKNR